MKKTNVLAGAAFFVIISGCASLQTGEAKHIYVADANGAMQLTFLAENHCKTAEKGLQSMANEPEAKSLDRAMLNALLGSRCVSGSRSKELPYHGAMLIDGKPILAIESSTLKLCQAMSAVIAEQEGKTFSGCIKK